MRDQIVTLKYKSDGMISIRIPVPVLIISGGNLIDDQISAVILIQPSDNIQKCRLSRTTGTKNRNKFTIAQIQADIIQRLLYQISGSVFFAYIFDL